VPLYPAIWQEVIVGDGNRSRQPIGPQLNLICFDLSFFAVFVVQWSTHPALQGGESYLISWLRNWCKADRCGTS
jgi:hypothetical protein